MKKSIIKTPTEFMYWMSECKKTFAFDTECTSLNWLDLEIVGFSIADGRQACYVQLNRKNKSDRDNRERMLEILDYYLGESKVVIFANAAFDLMALRKEGIIVDD